MQLPADWTAFDPDIPQAYRDHRAAPADDVVAQIRSAGGQAIAAEADVSDPRMLIAEFARRHIARSANLGSDHWADLGTCRPQTAQGT